MRETLRSALMLAALSCAAAGFGSAQVVEKKSLTLEGARAVIAAAKVEAQKLNAPGGVIAVVDDGGNLMALERLDGTFAAGANISIGKARTAVQFKRPTRFFEELINSSGKGRTVMTALSDFTPLIGGVPIEVDGAIVGGVGVSGAASAQQDEELAIAGANALKPAMGMTGAEMSPQAMPAVTYFDSKTVAAAFVKGSVLLDGSQGRTYMVHASHREKAGMAEVHTLDADIIYVLKGSATFVTGGKVMEGHNIEPTEIRGASIEGGETRQLSQGDVIVVPKGTPHWFQEIKGPFDYYVVKVR
ncbi:MAG: heme-binding protein [Terriglobales bacterium]